MTTGQDATISWDMLDFRSVNTLRELIGIRASHANQKSHGSDLWNLVLDDGDLGSFILKRQMKGKTGAPLVEDPTLALGTVKVKNNGTTGSTWGLKVSFMRKMVWRSTVRKDHEKIL